MKQNYIYNRHASSEKKKLLLGDGLAEMQNLISI